MSTKDSSQTMKPTTAAKRLGIYLPAAPEEFRASTPSRAELEDLERNPPEWLVALRRNGPHPRPVVAGRLGVSISGLARGGVSEALTTEQIQALRDDPPQWLVAERAIQAKVRAEEERLRTERAD
ncbi:hypothetical protein EXU48_16270 [Occultella glacieicola]|uniref:Uncharacterized protein n=1 Tax=Occultella glacieicola TaxID=2518684 RepID=A0ABY2E181_9MICO|nr:DUF5997 family protein [Occultella glacieicola]TDE91686.1 hypothetical protein EXU48_16270 [Occultella glacieicola]